MNTATTGTIATLDVEVLADSLPVASIRISMPVMSLREEDERLQDTAKAVWYEDVFASYAREDINIVQHLKSRYAALGIYLFVDTEDLRAGAYWRNELFKRIDRSHLFQLFWSQSAKLSEYVEIEWQRALQAAPLKGGHFIRPIYWQDPMPDIPEPLRAITFYRVNVADYDDLRMLRSSR
jgi:hypothetical protein